MDLFVYLSSP